MLKNSLFWDEVGLFGVDAFYGFDRKKASLLPETPVSCHSLPRAKISVGLQNLMWPLLCFVARVKLSWCTTLRDLSMRDSGSWLAGFNVRTTTSNTMYTRIFRVQAPCWAASVNISISSWTGQSRKDPLFPRIILGRCDSGKKCRRSKQSKLRIVLCDSLIDCLIDCPSTVIKLEM